MRASFQIGGRRVGEGAPCLIVAELSANHGGKLDVALATVKAAADAGADAIKLQTYTPDTLTLKSRNSHFVVKTDNIWSGRTLYDLYAEAMTPWEWHAELKSCAEANGLLWFSTPFDVSSVEFLRGLKAGVFKIASFEIVDLPLVERIASTGQPLIVSTGMATLGEIEAALSVCHQAGNRNVALLRCVSAYPASPASMNLESMRVLQSLGAVVGLSDHTRSSTAAIAAVALGAKILEKHFILDRSLGGPDSFFSLEPSEFKQLVSAVREAEAAMGECRFGAGPEEAGSLVFRRSLFVAKDVARGEVLTCDHVRSVRPGYGLESRHLPFVLGRLAASDVAAGTPLTWDMVGVPPPRHAIDTRPLEEVDLPLVLGWRDTYARENGESDVPSANALADRAHRFLALDKADPVGMIDLRETTPGRCEVSVVVAPHARGRGYGKALLAEAERMALAGGTKVVEVALASGAENALKVVKSMGYYHIVRAHHVPAGGWRCERRIAPYGQ